MLKGKLPGKDQMWLMKILGDFIAAFTRFQPQLPIGGQSCHQDNTVYPGSSLKDANMGPDPGAPKGLPLSPKAHTGDPASPHKGPSRKGFPLHSPPEVRPPFEFLMPFPLLICIPPSPFFILPWLSPCLSPTSGWRNNWTRSHPSLWGPCIPLVWYWPRG